MAFLTDEAPRWAIVATLCLLSALMFGLRSVSMFGNQVSIWPLCLVCFVPMFVAQKMVVERKGNAIASLVPAVTIAAINIINWNKLGGNMWIGAIVGLLQGMCVGAVPAVFTPATNLEWSLGVALVWMITEWIIYSLGYGIAPTLPSPMAAVQFLMLPVNLVGWYVLDALLMFTNCVLSIATMTYSGWFVSSRKLLGQLGVVWGVWAVTAAIQEIAGSSTGGARAPAYVASIHPGSAYPVYSTQGMEAMIEMTKAAASDGANVAVWPEGWIDTNSAHKSCSDVAEKEVSPLARQLGMHVVVGCRGELGNNYILTVNPFLGGGAIGGNQPESLWRMDPQDNLVVLTGESRRMLGEHHQQLLKQENASYTMQAMPMSHSDKLGNVVKNYGPPILALLFLSSYAMKRGGGFDTDVPYHPL